MKNMLVTGGAGFIGSNFIHYMIKNYDYNIINLDSLTYAGNLDNLADLTDRENYRFIKGDICNPEKIESVFTQQEIHCVVHFAAESHVDRSIENPQIFFTTNLLGTQILLDAAKRHWKLHPEDPNSRAYQDGVKFLQVSTDEVYGALAEDGLFTETSALSPNNPYSASKAAADLLVGAYYKTYGLPVNITRSSNNYGPGQFPEKLIPLMISNCKNNIPLPVYGDGKQVRDWLHVSDHCTAIAAVLQRGKPGEIYNIGGHHEKTNLELVRLIVHALGKDESLIQHVADRPGHDRRYAMDNTKITNRLGWRPTHEFEQGMAETIQWYLSHQEWLDRIASGQYRA